MEKGFEAAGGVLSSTAKKGSEALGALTNVAGMVLGDMSQKITSAGELLVKAAQAPDAPTKDSGGPQPQIIINGGRQTQNVSDYGY